MSLLTPISIATLVVVASYLPLSSPARAAINETTVQTDVGEKARASIVLVTGEDKAGMAVSPGLGFWIAPNLVATDQRIVELAVKIHVSIPGRDGSLLNVISRDSYQYATILTVSSNPGVPLPLGDSNMTSVSEKLLLVTDSNGQLNASENMLKRRVTIKDRDYFQLSGELPASSRGAPVINVNGEVVGITTEIPDKHSGMLAVPSDKLNVLLRFRNLNTDPRSGTPQAHPNSDQITDTAAGVPSLRLAAEPVDTKPVVIKGGQPRYTEAARVNHTMGTIRMRILVGEDGDVKETRVTKGLPDGLIEQAVIAAMNMKFKPATRNGASVKYSLPIEVEFNLR